MNRMLAGFMFFAFIAIALLAILTGSIIHASSVNPNGQCMEGLWGTVLYVDRWKMVNGFSIDVCKYTNPENITVSAYDFCYTVNYHWPRMYKTITNIDNDYICWINTSVETNWNTPNAVYRTNN